jgi:hypothetical protein
MYGNLDVNDYFVVGETGGLESTAEAEEMLVEEVEGVKIDTTHLVEKLEGHAWSPNKEEQAEQQVILKIVEMVD